MLQLVLVAQWAWLTIALAFERSRGKLGIANSHARRSLM